MVGQMKVSELILKLTQMAVLGAEDPEVYTCGKGLKLKELSHISIDNSEDGAQIFLLVSQEDLQNE